MMQNEFKFASEHGIALIKIEIGIALIEIEIHLINGIRASYKCLLLLNYDSSFHFFESEGCLDFFVVAIFNIGYFTWNNEHSY